MVWKRPERRDVVLVGGGAFVVATTARLVNLVEFAIAGLSSPTETLVVLVEFWRPVLVLWAVLSLLGLFAVASRRRFAAGSEAVDPEPNEGRIEVVEHAGTTSDALEALLERAESVLQSQLSVLADTDDKAVRTVRVEVVLLGVVASAAQFTSATLPTNVWMRLGGVCFVGSIVAGIFTYSTSSPDFGPGPAYVREPTDEGDSTASVYLQLIRGYGEAIAHNRTVVNVSARCLFLTQSLLVAGLVFGGVGVVTAV